MMSKVKVKPDPREELSRLQEWYDAEKSKLLPAIEDADRAEAEKKQREHEASLSHVDAEIRELAKFVIDLAERADKAIEAARQALVERQQVIRDIAEKSKSFPDRQVNENPYHYERHYRSGLNVNGFLKFARIDTHHDGQSFVSQDVRTLARWIDAETMARAAA